MLELLTPLGIAGLALATAGQAMMRRWPTLGKAAAAPVAHVEPVLPKPTVSRADASDEWAAATNTPIRKLHIRRADVAKEKVIERFVAWMAGECYAGWQTSAQAYDSFRTFAWEQRYEELDRVTFLSLLAVETGVIKRRAYIQKNDTYRHLRAAAKAQERAVVYRLPTTEELAAAKHKKALKDAEVRQRLRVPKVRLDPGGRQHPRSASAAETGLKNNDLGLPADAFDVAA